TRKPSMHRSNGRPGELGERYYSWFQGVARTARSIGGNGHIGSRFEKLNGFAKSLGATLRARTSDGPHAEGADETGQNFPIATRTCKNRNPFASPMRIISLESESDSQNAIVPEAENKGARWRVLPQPHVIRNPQSQRQKEQPQNQCAELSEKGFAGH